MSMRAPWCAAAAVALAVISPYLLALGGVQAGDVSLIQWWFFAIPEHVTALLGLSRDARLPAYLACYTFQYFAILYLASTAVREARRPRGIEAAKAFEVAVTRFHER